MENETTTHEARVEEVGPCKKQLRITIPPERIQEEIDKQYTDIIQNTQFPGFRKGRVPRKLVEKRFGEQILVEVKNTLVTDTFEKTLEEHALDPIGEPEIEYEAITLVPGESLSFEVLVEVKPTIELPEYRGIEVEREVAEIPDSDVDEALERFAKSRATYEPSRAKQIKPDDLVIADTSLVQGDAVTAHQENDHFVPEQGRVFGIPVPELADHLKGAKLGESTEIAVDVQGRAARGAIRAGAATLRITPHEIKRLKVPKVDEKLAQSLDFDSVDELREDVRKQLRHEAEREADRKVEDRILDRLLEMTSFDLPEGIVGQELEHSLERERLRLLLDGVEEAEADKRIEAMRTEAQEWVRARLKKAFLLEKIAAAEKIFVTEETIRATVAAMAARQGKSPDELYDWFESQGRIGALRTEIRERATREALRKAAKIADKKG